jgi:hypothetical protein
MQGVESLLPVTKVKGKGLCAFGLKSYAIENVGKKNLTQAWKCAVAKCVWLFCVRWATSMFRRNAAILFK